MQCTSNLRNKQATMQHAMFLEQPVRYNPRRGEGILSISVSSSSSDHITPPSTISLSPCRSSYTDETYTPRAKWPISERHASRDPTKESVMNDCQSNQTNVMLAPSPEQAIPDGQYAASESQPPINTRPRRRQMKAACQACRKGKAKVCL